MEEVAERRSESRKPQVSAGSIQVGIPSPGGGFQVLKGKLIDYSSFGLGVETVAPLEVGGSVTFWGPSLEAAAKKNQKPARVVHCRLHEKNSYRTGCSFETESSAASSRSSNSKATEDAFVDYYEGLQISPHADPDTIQRVYRMLAQRFHPDNTESGNSQAFQFVLRAYRVLSDPESRAAYDVEYGSQRALRWKIFDQSRSVRGVEAEKRKRWGMLSILYSQRVHQPEKPGLTIRDLEELLGCPREHLEFGLWYLRDTGLITAGDQGRFMITAKGVDAAEQDGVWEKRAEPLMLEEARPRPEGPTTNSTTKNARPNST